MLTRVQRELAAVQPLSLYKKQNSFALLNSNNRNPQVVIAKDSNGYCGAVQDTNQSTLISNMGAKRKIQLMLQEVTEKREIRQRKQSDQGLGSDLEIQALTNTKTQHYKQKLNIYNFLNRPAGFWATSYHILVFILVFACLIVTVFSNINKFASGAWKFILLFEKVIIIWFSSEFILRLWASSCKEQYQGWRGKVKYLSVPAHILDIVIITSSIIIVLPIHTRNGHEVFAVSAFRGFHRFFSVLQIITLNRQLQPWKVLSSVIYDQREQLFIIFYLEFIALCFLAYLSYVIEKDDNENFDSIAESMWWAIVTLSTVGYGDRVPITWLGKLVSSIFTILGVAIFALPAGIIGAGLALKIEEEERNRQRKKKKVAAAVLIQRTWRCYKANSNYIAFSNFFRHKPMDLYKIQDYESIAMKFICLTRFFIAKTKFNDLLRPIDIKNIIESYKYGQMDVMNKVNYMQNSIDSIGTRVGLNENQIHTSQSNMRSRIENIESLMNDIEHKIDRQITIIDEFTKNPVFNNRLFEILENLSKNGNFTKEWKRKSF